MKIVSRVRKRLAIRISEVDFVLYHSINNSPITKTGKSKKILDVLLLGDEEAISGLRNMKSEEVNKRTKTIHKCLVT